MRRVDGKFLRVDGERFVIRGVSYGTFAADASGSQFPRREEIIRDFRMMRAAGINTVRIYTPPPLYVLDLATDHDLQVMIGLPWAQHVAFLDDRALQRDVRTDLVRQIRNCAAHPAALLFALGNEIPPA